MVSKPIPTKKIQSQQIAIILSSQCFPLNPPGAKNYRVYAKSLISSLSLLRSPKLRWLLDCRFPPELRLLHDYRFRFHSLRCLSNFALSSSEKTLRLLENLNDGWYSITFPLVKVSQVESFRVFCLELVSLTPLTFVKFPR